ncbi:MAG TPA: VIT domain-containing protein, partial [Pyrinomonadaceae bacterium]|nr:VIT domain-containing protein [Pyrinomonadaceae bacterium]
MNEEENRPVPRRAYGFSLFAGVILPIISITTEATTHISAEYLFDPIPTVWHLLLVVFVPLAQLQVWFAVRRGAPERLTLAGVVNAIAMAISIFYSIAYFPILPVALLLLPIGLGLLPLAPYSSLVACIVMRRHLKQIASNSAPKPFWVRKVGLLAGLSLTFTLIGLVELPSSLTRYGLRLAVSESPEIQAKGIRFLRSYGSKDYLLRRCYYQSGLGTDLISYLFDMQDSITPSEAQKIYYRVTGETFDTSEPPKRNGGRLLPSEEVDFDSHQGGQMVGAKLKELSLSSSKIDASADADGGVAYMQWTLVFQNDSQQQREARAEIQLPPGGVVSRLTLWVNGEEREAAFAGRSQVQQAYQQVTARRRDPVLVTTAGRDRVLVQCFPVPPDRGEMKIRLGITTPLI